MHFLLNKAQIQLLIYYKKVNLISILGVSSEQVKDALSDTVKYSINELLVDQ